jgi:hypothetical protein
MDWQIDLKAKCNWVWWCMLVIPALGRLRQEDLEFKASLGCIVNLRPVWA